MMLINEHISFIVNGWIVLLFLHWDNGIQGHGVQERQSGGKWKNEHCMVLSFYMALRTLFWHATHKHESHAAMIRHACVTTTSVHEPLGEDKDVVHTWIEMRCSKRKSTINFYFTITRTTKKRVERQLSKVRDEALDIKVFFSWLQL